MIWHSCHRQGLSTKLLHMILVFKRSQKREKRYKKEGKNYQTILVEVLIHTIQKKLHNPTQTKSQKKKDVIEVDNPDTHVMVPDDIERDFVKANHVYYVVLSPHMEEK